MEKLNAECFSLCGYVIDTALSSCYNCVLIILKCSSMVQRTLREAFSGSVLFWSKWLSISNWNLEFWKSKSSFWLCSFSSVPGPINIHLIFFCHVMNFFILDKLGKEWHHILLNQQMYWLMYLFFGKQLNYRSKMSLLSTSGQFWNLQGECWVSNHRCETARVIHWIPHSRSYSETSGLHSLMHTHTQIHPVFQHHL